MAVGEEFRRFFVRLSLSFSLSENSNSIRLEKHEQRFFLVPDRCANPIWTSWARARKKERAEIQTRRIFDARAHAHVPPFDRVSDGVHSRFSARVLIKARLFLSLFSSLPFALCVLQTVFRQHIDPSLSFKYARGYEKTEKKKARR